MGKLVEHAKKYNLIRDLKYADQIDNSDWNGLIEEKPTEYLKKYQEKDIVFVKEYYYQDGSVGTNHLFVIMEEGYGVPIEYFCFLISSNLNKLKFPQNYYLEKDEQNNLNKNSLVKTDIIYAIPKDSIICKIGTINDEQYHKYKEIFLKMYA